MMLLLKNRINNANPVIMELISSLLLCLFNHLFVAFDLYLKNSVFLPNLVQLVIILDIVCFDLFHTSLHHILFTLYLTLDHLLVY